MIVQARPRDLREVVHLIEQIDKNDTESRQRIKIFPLSYAVADEVAVYGAELDSESPGTGPRGPFPLPRPASPDKGARRRRPKPAGKSRGTGSGQLTEVRGDQIDDPAVSR